MEIYQLRSFTTVAREQNLTRAAIALHLSQSALSSQIKALEEELGVSLFQRTAKGMVLSEAGRILLSHAQNILDDSTAMKHAAAALRRGITASVTIGLNTDPAFLRISEINKRLALLHSNLNVIFHASETAKTVQLLKNKKIDLGFFYGQIQDPNIEMQMLAQVRICLVIPIHMVKPGRTLDWCEIAELPWVWVDNNVLFYQVLLKNMGDVPMAPARTVTAANEQIVRELVTAGQGVAIMREDEARSLAEQGKVRIWEKGWEEIPLSLGWLDANRDKKAVKAAREAIGYIWNPRWQGHDGSLSDKSWK